VPFPQLDTFPNALFGTSNNQNLGVHTALAATSETRTRLKDMSRIIRGALGAETREELLNDLAELGEAYEEGWESSSGSGGEE
jgi:hypothetical protein